MFIKSAANDTLQGKAIQAINVRWGEDSRNWSGRETIGIPVCKKKYAPFSFKVIMEDKDGNETHDNNKYNHNHNHNKCRVKVTVERMFGCRCHSAIRKTIIQQHGCRTGWEPFGQWSLKKAEDVARRQTERINSIMAGKNPNETVWSSEDEEAKASTMCNNGNCAWKLRTKFDDIKRELTGEESDPDQIYDFYDNPKPR
jgi:hypothetical protein